MIKIGDQRAVVADETNHSPEALLSCNKTAILWRGSRVVGGHLLPVALTYRLMREIPGRGETGSPRRMRVSEPLLIRDSAGEPIGSHLGVVKLMHISWPA
jgi:hypothetical protein